MCIANPWSELIYSLQGYNEKETTEKEKTKKKDGNQKERTAARVCVCVCGGKRWTAKHWANSCNVYLNSNSSSSSSTVPPPPSPFPCSRLKARAMAMTKAPLFRGVNEKRLDVISQSAAPLLIPSQIPSRSLSTLAISQINQFALRFAALPWSVHQKLEHDMDIALIYHVPNPISPFP